MAEQKFQPGDVVTLKSGGPRMTVVDYGKYGHGDEESYLCKWFDNKHNRMQDTFTEAELERDVPRQATFRVERG